MDPTRPWPLEGVVRSYAWGSTTAIPELQGREPGGQPEAELWLGAHPDAPSRVERTPLDAWIASDPERILGERVAREFGGELPFLLKVLAAAQPLSIQAHPDAEQARAGFARENAAGIPADAPHRCYRDPRPKPELICALTRFRALDRFRAPGEIVAGISALGVPELTERLAPLRDAPDREGLAAFFEGWMTLDPEQRSGLVERAARAVAGSDDPAHEVLRDLARRYPGDPGVLAPLLLNLVELAPGEALFLPAGELHSYLSGTGIELMGSSDNVLRGGLTGKHVDVPELLSTLTFVSGPVDVLRPRELGAGERRYATPAHEFSLSVLEVADGRAWSSPRARGVEILLCVEGAVRLANEKAAIGLERGTAAVVPAAADGYRVEGSGRLYRAAAGHTAG